MATLTLINVSKTYLRAEPGASAVREVSFEVAEGEFVALAGPAHAGKSTLLRIIAGLDAATGGEIHIASRPVGATPPKERNVALVFGEGALYPQMSVRDNIAFGLKLRNYAPAEISRRVNDAASVLAVESLLDSKPAALSMMQQLSVEIARAIARQPQVLLFDEPLAALAPEQRVEARTELKRLQPRFNAAAVFATRDAADAFALGDRIVAISDGVVQQIGSPAAIYETPANLFAAKFFGRPGMNLIRGTLKQERDSVVFREADDGTIEVRLMGSAAAAARNFGSNVVTLGVRPEDLQVTQLGTSSGGAASFRAIVDVVEAAGAERIFHLDTGAHRIVSRSQLRVGDGELGRRVQVALDPEKIHLFNPESGSCIV